MSKFGTEEAKRVAELSRIDLNTDQLAKFSLELRKVVDFVEQLQDVDTVGVEPTSQVTGLSDVWREDIVRTGGLSTEELLASAPETLATSIKVKRVLE
jgi:aspartyl-tRNA(Asn)/glutamyl-tRNA(Gln) amidotransferase subunit C